MVTMKMKFQRIVETGNRLANALLYTHNWRSLVSKEQRISLSESAAG